MADTNNQRIVRINLKTHEWAEIIFDGLAAPRIEKTPACEVITADPVAIAAGQDVELVLDIKLPPKTHLSPEAPWSVRVEADGRTLAQQTGKSDSLPLRVTVPAASALTGTTWTVTAAFAFCTDSDEGLCIPVQVAWLVPVGDAGTSARISLGGAVTAATTAS